MCRKLFCLISFVLVVGLVLTNVADAAEPGLVGWWKFDDGSGTTASDSSDNGNHGTLNGGPEWVAGQLGGALKFDGSNDYVGTGKSLLSNMSEFTLAGWVSTDNLSGSRIGLFGQNDCIELGFISVGTLQIWTPGGGSLDTAWGFADFTWHHIATVGDGTNLNTYVDGELVGTGGGSTSNYGSSAYSVNIGGGGVFDSSGNWFSGQIDDVRIYSRALSQAEIQAIMSLKKAYGPDPANGAENVLIDANLYWLPGIYAASHEVYFDPCEAKVESRSGCDVNGVSVPDPFYPITTLLDLSQTYYWAIDEVNGPPDYHIYEGDVWSFTTESGIARNPNPSDGAKEVFLDAVLSWSPGPVAVSHDVYLSTDEETVNNASRLAGDVDGDGQVDFADVFVLAEQWLEDTPVCSGPSADLNDDDNVNLADLAILGGDWMAHCDAVFKGNQDANSYDPCGFEIGQTYYWRIDEVNDCEGESPWKGDVWSFRTVGPPQINGAKVFGVRPGNPFLYTIPAAGQRPITFSADDLPDGLNLDVNTGRITGTVTTPGEYEVMLHAENEFGGSMRELRIVVGDTICLTPPMGWNSWNCWGCSVDDAKVRASADAMVSSGLINHGWVYVNIDDCWAGERHPVTGEIQSNAKFPDMAALCDYVHSKGLKIGLYTDCGPWTCAGYEGSEGHEAQDINTYASWGFDYVKIDWCNCGGKDPVVTYQIFGDALQACPRDIVFSICNWGLENPWEWGESVGGNLWRTTYDIWDTWGSMSGIGFGQAPLSEYAGPGHWNDPDMLVVGQVGWGGSQHPTKLTEDEQYVHISLWCLLSAPLLMGCNLAELDEFTLNLLTNDEVLEVNQDPLGHQAERVSQDGSKEVWAKSMEDGSKAVGLFNRGLEETTVTASWSDIGIEGHQAVRDLWQQKDLGIFEGEFEVEVPRHGVVLVRITAAAPPTK